MADELEPTPTGQKLMERDRPEPSEGRAALVQRWLEDIATARKHWKPDFDRMRRNMKFAAGKQWPNQKEDDHRFRVNLIQRVLKVTVSSLYAKNPTVVFKRRQTLDFTIWDGKLESLMQAQQTAAMAGELANDSEAAATPEGQTVIAAAQAAQMLLADVQQGMERRKMLDKVGKTLVACVQYYLSEGKPPFKVQMKQMIRRARTTAVGYIKLGFRRDMELSEQQTSAINKLSEKLAVIGVLSADLADGEIDPNSAEAEELRLAIETIKSQPEQITSEGLVFDFPGSTRLIPSISTTKLMGWVGCEWIAEEIMLTPDRIKEVYGKDIGKSYHGFRTVGASPEGGDVRRTNDKKNALARVYQVFDKRTGMEMVVCEGYPDFLKEPGEPAIFIEQFFPYFAVTFNDVEDEGRLFPESDVENLTPIQREFNRSKEGLRQHRIANRPLYASPKGAFEEQEVKTLADHPAHTVIELNGLEKGRPVTDLLQPVGKVGIDPNLYETNSLLDDMFRVTGNTEATLGGISGGTATENTIAEGARQGTIGLDSDDFDDMLTELFRACGSVLLTELDQATVKDIAGPGAVWPELSREEIAREVWLEVKAGSSGRPNAAEQAARFERLYPLMVQVPGISPRWLAERAVTIADDDADLSEAIAEGLPSIVAMNQQMQPGSGDPDSDPNAQGNHGGDPQRPHQRRDNGQPAFNTGPN